MLSEYLKKVKYFFESSKNDLYIAVLIFFVSLASFGLGRLSVLWPKKEPIRIVTSDELQVTKENGSKTVSSLVARNSSLANGRYVASKSGLFYHYSWCAGALKIKEANKIFFNTKEEAESRGYKPAGNCPGL